MQKHLRLLTICALLFSTSFASAAYSPLAVSIVPPVQFPADDYSITGARLSLGYGRHRDIYGLDLGLIGNITEQTFTGIGVSGGFNITRGTTTITGLQAALITNMNIKEATIVGLQVALVNYNEAVSTITGVQLGIANLSAFTDVYGLQAGIYNRAQSVYGLQVGLVNYATNLHGLQIGIVNFNNSGPFAVSPILNVGF